jgi:eukaryotic-like serine/threonine-protein kinase
LDLLELFARYNEPVLSPDGKRVTVDLFERKTELGDIWIMELSRGALSRFTFDNATNIGSSVWSPDGNRIAFGSGRLGIADIYQRSSSGAGNQELLLKSENDKWPSCWSPDGRYIIYDKDDPKNKYDLWALPTFGDRKPFPIVQTEFNETHAQISPDGRWIAYVSDETTRAEVYVRPFPTTSKAKWQISTNGGDQPQWRGDGKELFFISLDKKLVTVQVKSGLLFEASAPAALFQARVPDVNPTGNKSQFAASQDGQRFLINKIVEKQVSSPITVVVNWPAELKQ